MSRAKNAPLDADLMRIVFGENGAQHDRLPPPNYRLAQVHLRALLAVANAVGRAKRGAWFDRQMVEAHMERAFAAHDRLVRRAAPRGTRRGGQ